MIQLIVIPVQTTGDANNVLRDFQRQFPKREIIGCSMTPAEFPGGWFLTITYRIKE